MVYTLQIILIKIVKLIVLCIICLVFFSDEEGAESMLSRLLTGLGLTLIADITTGYLGYLILMEAGVNIYLIFYPK